MAGVLCRARISNAACVRAVLIPACGVGMWLQGSQSAAALEPRAVGGTPQRSGADRLASEPPNTIEEGPLASGLAVGPTGPTGFATAYANNYSCAFEFQPCDLGGFSGVSCASETSCTAVGTAVGNTSLAEGWGGTKWTIEPTPAPSDATYSTLASVSCVILTKCLAVGSYYGSSGELPLAELWNGSSWTIRPPPSPPEASYSVLSYVQCASTEECMAVGSYYSTTTSQTVPLAELWDGSAWTIQSVPLPSGAESGALTGVSCPAEATCSSVGAYSTPGTGQTPLAEAWDGTNWTIQSTAIPAGSSSSALHAVWCESAKSCSAVGINASSSGGSLTLAESWDGTSWTIEPTPNPNASSYNGFTNLSCAPEGKPCTAVGFSGNTTLTESWDGMTWGELPITPEPAGSTQSSFSDVSCAAPNVCTAVGQYLDSTEGPTGAYLTLAERWNGTSWTIQPTANPALAGTDTATNITSSTADLHGTVYPGGAATTCYFEYGTTSSYGSTIPCAQTTGPGAAPVSVSANLAGLSPNTTYYFNLVATNAGGGMSYTPGPASFTTLDTSGGGGGDGSSGGGGGGSSGPSPVQKYFTSPDFKIVQYIKDFNEYDFGGGACVHQLEEELGLSPFNALASCGGVADSANPDPALNMGGGAWNALVASKQYRGLIHLPSVTVGCVQGQVVTYSIGSGFERSGGYTPNPVVGGFTQGDEYTQPPYGYLYNRSAPEVVVSGSTVTIEYLNASRIADLWRGSGFRLTGYDAPFIWAELREVVGCNGYAFVPVFSDFPTYEVYENDKLTVEGIQSLNLASFIASGGRDFHAPGVGIFDPYCGLIHEYASEPALLSLPVGCGYANIALSLGVMDAASVRLAAPTVTRAALLRDGRASVAITPPGSGEVLVSWLAANSASARTSRRKPVVIAISQHIRTTNNRKLDVTVRLTKVGRRMLARSRRLSLIEQVLFVDSAGQATRARRSFEVRR
jgi:hypothetical protein